MTQTGFSIRMDNDLKREFGAFCEDVGMTMSTAFVIFAKTVVRERRFPFEITTEPIYRKRSDADRREMLGLLERMRIRAAASGRPEMSMDEIDAEITASRRESMPAT